MDLKTVEQLIRSVNGLISIKHLIDSLPDLDLLIIFLDKQKEIIISRENIIQDDRDQILN